MYKLTKEQLEDLIYDARIDLRESSDNLINALSTQSPSTTKIIIAGTKGSIQYIAKIAGKDYTKIFGDDPYDLIGKLILSFENYFNIKVEFK